MLTKSFLLLVTIFSACSFNAQITVHSENFNTGLGTWSSVNVSDASDVWTPTTGYMQINGFGGGNDEDWITSPAINMNAQTNEYFLFDYNDFYNGALIELYYSVNYNGGNTPADVSTATWVNIPLRVIDINSTSCFSSLFLRHPAIDVSGITGASVYFAFKYTGTSSNSKQYQIDNIHIEAEYYGAVNSFIQNGGSCSALNTEIFNTIKTQTNVVEYSSANFDLWDGLLHTDRRMNDAGTAEIVWDMFTDFPITTGEFEFDPCTGRDYGTCAGGEGSCYNREHSFPRSWWGGTIVYPTDTINFDLHHITPADKSMNTIKSSYPPGIVQTVVSSGSNGFKVGTNTSYPCGGAMKYFEPINEYKGDYARMYLFLATRYQMQIGGWFGNNTQGDCALTGASFPAYQPWLMNLLLTWHAQDPVSQKEIDRNNAVYAIQGNRNPYIDNPSWVGYVWGDNLGNTCSALAPGACTPNTGTQSVTACGTYTWSANNQTYTAGGSYTSILTNVSGCDSTVTLNLSINNSNSSVQSITACDTYTWATNGQTYTTSGTYSALLSTISGCDSTVTLNLTVNNSISGSETVNACGSFTWLANNQTYTSGGSYTTILTSSTGCDSTVTLNLSLGAVNTGNETIIACNTYTWPANNQTYTLGGVYSTTLTNVFGCDSVVTLNLTVNNSNSSSEIISACNAYTWGANNQTYTASGTYSTTLVNVSNCDSVITLNLTINQIDTTISNVATTLTATMSGVNYQWLDCNTGFSVLNGETSQSFTASVFGTYAVEITANGCTDTSACYLVTDLAVSQFDKLNKINVYPNPSKGEINIESEYQIEEIYLYNIQGKLILQITPVSTGTISILLPIEKGNYILECKTARRNIFKRIVRN